MNMNHQKTIERIAQRSGESQQTCENVLKCYEKYAENHLKEAGRKHLDQIAEAIAASTGDKQTCKAVLTELFNLIDERTAKIPFLNRLVGGK
ncbi:hypothetical protein NRIC_11110 [Enterococcus florum]|uniref:Uncharacterized protein n=1 Tax=Enterococcus florum TaxID=2480627 RepID=A0A4P5P668_9ENTE|nr:hypothetical protein [Enterococcus florum]GCF93220.1 hypothetical protein NRIC_11110 [Enterococcus florum]